MFQAAQALFGVGVSVGKKEVPKKAESLDHDGLGDNILFSQLDLSQPLGGKLIPGDDVPGDGTPVGHEKGFHGIGAGTVPDALLVGLIKCVQRKEF